MKIIRVNHAKGYLTHFAQRDQKKLGSQAGVSLLPDLRDCVSISTCPEGFFRVIPGEEVFPVFPPSISQIDSRKNILKRSRYVLKKILQAKETQLYLNIAKGFLQLSW